MFGGAAPGSGPLGFDGEENKKTEAADNGKEGGHFHAAESSLVEPFALVQGGEFEFRHGVAEFFRGRHLAALHDEAGGKFPFPEPGGLGGNGKFLHFLAGELFNLREAGAYGTAGRTHFAEENQLAVQALHSAAKWLQELGFPG